MEPKYLKYTLKCGLKLLMIPIKNSLLSIQFTSKIGEDIERVNTKDLEIVHTLEHLFSHMTSEKYPNGRENIYTFNNLGIDHSAEVTEIETKYNLFGHKKNIDIMFDMIINTILYFKVDENIFQTEKKAIIQELNDIINDTWFNLDLALNENMFPNHLRSVSQKEKKKNIKNLTSKQIYDFYKKNYSLTKSCLTITGDFDIKRTLKLIKNIFNSINNKNINFYYKPIEFLPKIIHKKIESVSTNIYIIFKLNINTYDSFYKNFVLLTDILTENGLNSELYKVLRGKGLVYSVSSEVNTHPIRKDMSYFIINTQTNNTNIILVVKYILEVINKFKQITFTKDYFNNIINNYELEYYNNNNKNKISHYENLYTNYFLWDKPIKNNKDIFEKKKDINPNNISKTFNKLDFRNMSVIYGGTSNLNKKIKELLNKVN